MQGNKLGRAIEILLVEDSLDDAEFTQLALGEARIANQMHHVEDGEAAIAFLRNPDNPRPDLILLDLNMPKMDGREVLRVVKHDESLKSIPVAVLTTSDLESDIQYTYQNYTNCYMRKPVAFSDFVQILGRFQTFWLQTVELPSN